MWRLIRMKMHSKHRRNVIPSPEREPFVIRSDERLTLKTFALFSLHGGNSTRIILFETEF